MSSQLEQIIAEQQRLIEALRAAAKESPAAMARKRYYERHREQILAATRQRYAEDAALRERVRERQRDYVERHREQIRARGSTRHDCDCGSHFTQSNRSRHMRSHGHLAWAAKQ